MESVMRAFGASLAPGEIRVYREERKGRGDPTRRLGRGSVWGLFLGEDRQLDPLRRVWFLAAALSIYSMMIQARVIGLIYRRKREALGWE
jgi:hypothetical protein